MHHNYATANLYRLPSHCAVSTIQDKGNQQQRVVDLKPVQIDFPVINQVNNDGHDAFHSSDLESP